MSGYEFRGHVIPDYMMDGIERYIKHGIEPGSFLLAVLQNDLKEAVGMADRNNLHALPAYVAYFYNEAPAACWGSPEKVEAWIEAKLAEREGEAA